MEKWRLKSCIHLTIPEIPKNTTNINIYQCPESIQSIHPFSTTYLCLCRGGSFSREAQTCLTPATFFTSSGRTMSHSQASWEIKFLKWVRGLPQDIFPVRQKTLPRRYPRCLNHLLSTPSPCQITELLILSLKKNQATYWRKLISTTFSSTLKCMSLFSRSTLPSLMDNTQTYSIGDFNFCHCRLDGQTSKHL